MLFGAEGGVLVGLLAGVLIWSGSADLPEDRIQPVRISTPDSTRKRCVAATVKVRDIVGLYFDSPAQRTGAVRGGEEPLERTQTYLTLWLWAT